MRAVRRAPASASLSRRTSSRRASIWSAVAALVAVLSSDTRSTIQDATVAVMTPIRLIPPTISRAAMSRPTTVTG
nr:hypothetical protein [Mycobacterium pinniadriaticum]